jgi:hypothetical protein
LATLFHGGEPAAKVIASTAAYVPPKQPKKGILQRKQTGSRDWVVFVFNRFYAEDYDSNCCSSIFIVNQSLDFVFHFLSKIFH